MEHFKISSFKYWPHIGSLCLLLAGFGAYRYFAYYDTRSDDAYVSANLVNMVTLVSGPVTKIYIKENQLVKKDDKLIEIDPLPYQYAVQLAKAKLNTARLNDENDTVDLIQAELNEAEYRLQHATLVAPADGYVTNFNTREGQYIKAGDGLFALVETKEWWVVTRYKETAIRLIKPGDKAEITIDMYPGKIFHGHVNSIGWGINRVQSGNVAPSTLTYLEPTEDWIRIAQRFPVRIDIDDVSDEYPLRIGASAVTATYR